MSIFGRIERSTDKRKNRLQRFSKLRPDARKLLQEMQWDWRQDLVDARIAWLKNAALPRYRVYRIWAKET